MYIKTKISLNFLVMALLMISIGAGTVLMSFYISEKLDVLSGQTLPALQALNRLRTGAWDSWQLHQEGKDLSMHFQAMEKDLLEFRERSELAQTADLAQEMRARLLHLQERIAAGDFSGFQAGASQLNALIDQAVDAENAFLLKTGRNVNGFVDTINFISILFIAGALLFCLLPGWWLAHNISRALGKASRAADKIASGDLSERLSEEGKDEVTELAGAFNRMVETIRQADEEITREVEDRIHAERRAQSAAKAKSDFLAHMSHEFRTPLNGILGYSQMLSMDKGLSEKNLEVVKSLRKSGESLLELINDVLDLTKIEAHKMNLQKTRFYLGDFLDSLVESYSEQVQRKGLEFRIELDEKLPEDILSDPIRLRQILVNLLGNAIKFTDKGHIGLNVQSLEGGVRFSVIDSGTGIAPENHAAVMQPFTQLENTEHQSQGTGLGLPISNRLLEMMGTHLNIRSALGEGTTFWFDLPQPDVKHRKLVQVPNRIRGYRGKARKILIGEEGTGTASLLMPLLQRVGFEVLHLRSPQTFLEKCEIFLPDVVLVDLYFAHVDGIEILREIETIYGRIPEAGLPGFFLFSDHRNPEDRTRSLRLGADAFLGIPIRFTDLLAALKTQLDLVWIESDEPQDPPPPEEEAGNGMPVEEAVPDVSELQNLLSLAKSGNIRMLSQELTRIREEDPRFESFAGRLLEMCSRYRINAILQELEGLNPTPDPGDSPSDKEKKI